MKRASLAVAAALVVGVLVPVAAHADSVNVECTLDGVKANDTTCTTEFTLTPEDTPRFASILFTHGDYHALPSAGAYGQVKIQWFDAADSLVDEFTCYTVAANADYNPTNFVRGPWCQEGEHKVEYARGAQRLVVTAVDVQNAGATGVRMHGRLVLHGPDDLV